MNGWKKIFAKEIREMIRDRRVLQATVIMPIFIIALFVFLFAYIGKQLEKPSTMPMAIMGIDAEQFTQDVDTGLKPLLLSAETVEQGQKMLDDKKAKVFLVFPENFTNDAAANGATIKAYYKSDDPLSQGMLRGFVSQIDRGNVKISKQVLESNNLNPQLAEAIKVEEIDLAKDKGIGASQITSLLPYLIVLWAFYGGMSIVSDLIAGEKERGTLETLLISPIKRDHIAFGKIMALLIVCFVSSMTTLAGVALIGALNLEVTKDIFPSGFHISPLGFALALIVTITLCWMFATLMASISAFARNLRESQTYLSLLSFVILLPAIFSQFIGFSGAEKAPWVAWTPVLNTAMAIRNALKDELDYNVVLGSVTVNLIIGLLFLVVTVRLFRREEILLRV